ncbi:hypothetical protein H4582DRAFT_2062359 [Lactarius indigo]|nr:hypothetical protein H4582DRAFT_2062359 [Lactarius indigo]
MPARTPAPILETITSAIPKAFEQAQNSSANHQKTLSPSTSFTLRRLPRQRRFAGAMASNSSGNAHSKIASYMVNRVLVVKKGTGVADRAVKFVAGYIKFLNAKAAEERLKQEEGEDNDDESTATRFTYRLLKHFLKGFEAKDKNVISHLGELEYVFFLFRRVFISSFVSEDIYNTLRTALLERAVAALAKICGSEDLGELAETNKPLQRCLRTSSPTTLPHTPTVLARTRHRYDSTQIVYGNILLAHAEPPDGALPGAAHPRALTIAQRELIVRNGLGDREPTRGVEDALLSVFVTRVDVFDALEFDAPEYCLRNAEDFWRGLTPEKAFLVRVFVDHCVTTKETTRLEKVLPVVTAHAFRIQEAYNTLLDVLDGAEGPGGDDEAIDEHEFILAELLRLALNLDMLMKLADGGWSNSTYDIAGGSSFGLVTRCLDVLRTLSSSERDLIRIVVEVVHELRDANDDDEVINELINDDDDTTIDGPTTAAPCPTRSQVPRRDDSRGTGAGGCDGRAVCLGLCCLITRRMALNSFQLFLSQVQTAPEVLKLRVLQVVFDVLMVHEGDFLANASVGGGRVIEFLLQVLGNEESDKVQALMHRIREAHAIGNDFRRTGPFQPSVDIPSPDTAENQELRQCLSYFFPAFSYSSPTHQRLMQETRKKPYASKPLVRLQTRWSIWTWPPHPPRALQQGCPRDDKKVLCQALAKLYLPPETADDDKASALAALSKFDNALSKRFEKQLEDFDELSTASSSPFGSSSSFWTISCRSKKMRTRRRGAFDEKRGARKRRSESVTTDATSADEEARTPPRGKGGKARSKRRRTSQSDEDEETTRRLPQPFRGSHRTMPRRAATKKVDMTPIRLEGDDDEDGENMSTKTTTMRTTSPRPFLVPSVVPLLAISRQEEEDEQNDDDDDDDEASEPADSIWVLKRKGRRQMRWMGCWTTRSSATGT